MRTHIPTIDSSFEAANKEQLDDVIF